MKRFSDFINKYWKAVFCVLWFVLVMTCFFIWGYIEVSAASDRDYFPMQQNQNDKFSSGILSKLESVLDSENNYIFVAYAFDSGQYRYFNYVTVPKSYNNGVPIIYGEKNNDLIHFSLYKNPASFTVSAGQINFDTTNPNRYGNIGYGNTLSYFGSMTSSEYSTGASYVSNFMVYTNNTSTRKIVLFYDDGFYIPDDDTAREDMEKPNIEDYIPDWTQTPTFDDSTIESALSSVYDSIVWVGSNIKDTLSGLGQFLGDTFRWTAQKIIDNIRSSIEALGNTLKGALNDIKNFAENIKDAVTNIYDLITEPFSASELNTQLSNSSFYGALNTTITNIRGFGASLTQASEPENLSITIDLTAIGWGTSQIDFNWLKTFRNIIRLIIGCLMVYWLIITVITSINNIVSSGGDNEE